MPVLYAVPTLLVFILLLPCISYCYYQWKYRRILSEARKLYPSKYKPLPIIGHVHHIVWRGWEGATRMIMEIVEDALEKHIDTLCLWIGPFPYILVMGSGDVQKVLTSSTTSEKPEEMEYFKYAGGNGLLTAPNNIWKMTRRHINPLFHPRNLAHLPPTFNRNSRELVANLSEHVEGPTFDVFKHTMKTALQTVCHLIFGSQQKIDCESDWFCNLLVAVESIPDIFLKKLAKPWLRIDKIFKCVYKKELRNINEVLKNFTALYIKKNREKNYKPKGSDEKDNFLDNGLTLIDVYSTLQGRFSQFTENTLSDEIATLYATGLLLARSEISTLGFRHCDFSINEVIIKGSDTVGATVATCLLALGQHPEIQDELFEEIESVVQDDHDVTLTHLNNMPYLDQVFKETLRWSCLVPFVGRKPSEDVHLSECTVAAGWTVGVVLAGAHMDPRIYPEPKIFNPDRFSTKNSKEKAKCSFLPFSGGPRNCIGKEYSNMLFKIMLIHILRNYRVSTEMDFNTMKRKYMVILISSEGYKIKLHKRIT